MTAYAASFGLDPERIPAHVAIIMDGNGRWAQAQGKHRLFGHWQGYLSLKEIVYAADDLGVRYLTAYGFSSENWRRPADEVHGLMDLMQSAMRAEMEEMAGAGIRFRISGRLHECPDEVRNVFTEAMENTVHNRGLNFNLAINYGGRAEIVDAVRSLAEAVKRGEVDPASITEEDIGTRLYTPDIPDPDLLIRTAGEMRVSNFLLWELAYAELWVTQTTWPEFSREHLVAAIADYQKRTRRFGAVVE